MSVSLRVYVYILHPLAKRAHMRRNIAEVVAKLHPVPIYPAGGPARVHDRII